jgi:hypothetical protein
MLSEVLKFKPLVTNVFIGDVNYPELNDKNYIFVLYKYSSDAGFKQYEEEIKKNRLYVTSYDPDTTHTMIVFETPEHHMLNMMRYKDSAFSKMADGYKRKIMTYHRVSSGHPLYHILYKTEEAFQALDVAMYSSKDRETMKVPRHQEVGSLIDMQVEYYNDSYKTKPAISPNTNFLN